MNDSLSARVAACRLWRWMQGMRLWRVAGKCRPLPHRCYDGGGPDCVYLHPEGGHVIYEAMPHDGDAPDLADPATAGCIWALVREALAETQYLTRTDDDAVIECDTLGRAFATLAATDGERAAECLIWIASQTKVAP